MLVQLLVFACIAAAAGRPNKHRSTESPTAMPTTTDHPYHTANYYPYEATTNFPYHHFTDYPTTYYPPVHHFTDYWTTDYPRHPTPYMPPTWTSGYNPPVGGNIPASLQISGDIAGMNVHGNLQLDVDASGFHGMGMGGMGGGMGPHHWDTTPYYNHNANNWWETTPTYMNMGHNNNNWWDHTTPYYGMGMGMGMNGMGETTPSSWPWKNKVKKSKK